MKQSILLKTSSPLTIAVAAASLMTAQPVFAQDDASAEDGDGDVIVVTARKKAESLQEVPLSITAFSGDNLRDAGVTNLRDLSYLTPGLTLLDFGTETFVAPTIRGLSQSNVSGGQNNVSIFIDGIYIANFNAVNLALLDLERVEVVKGPVSALYGRNAFAGVINYVTKKPGDSLAGRLNGTVGSDNNYSIDGAIGGPIIQDLLSARIAVGYHTFDGTWEDEVTGRNFEGFEKFNIQGTFVATPSDSIEVEGSLYYGDDRFDAPARPTVTGNCGIGGVAAICGEHPDGDELTIEGPFPLLPNESGNDREIINASLRGSIDLGIADLSILAGYTDLSFKVLRPQDGVRGGIPFALNPGPGTVNLSTYFGQTQEEEVFSIEARVSSKQDQPFRWSFGGYFFDQDRDQITDLLIDSNPLPAGQSIAGFFQPTFLNSTGDIDDVVGRDLISTTQRSGFATIEYDFLDNLTFGAEGRFTSETQGLNEVIDLLFQIDADGPDGLEETFDFFDFRFTLDYTLANGTLLYASAARGTKAGGFNPGALPQFQAYDPEQNITYEVGAKASIADGRLLLNAAAFYIDWTDLQIFTLAIEADPPASVVTNASSASSFGFEVDYVAKIADGLEWGGGVAYTNPEFGEGSILAGGQAINCSLVESCAPNIITVNGTNVIDLDGFSLFRQSDWTFNTYVDMQRPVDIVPGASVFMRTDYSYQSRQFIDNNNLGFFGDRHILNMRAGIRKDNVSFTLWADNLLDDTTPTINGTAALLNTFTPINQPLLPRRRTYGATVNVSF